MTGTIQCFNYHGVGYPLKELIIKAYTEEDCKDSYAYFSAYGDTINKPTYVSFKFKQAGSTSYSGLDGYLSCEIESIILYDGYQLSYNHEQSGYPFSIESNNRSKTYIGLGGYWNRIKGENLIIDFTAEKVSSTTPVTGVSLNSSSINLIVGGTSTLYATVSPSTATNKNVIWSSSDTSVATVSNGVVTAKGEGSCYIAVETSDGGYTDYCYVTVGSIKKKPNIWIFRNHTTDSMKVEVADVSMTGSSLILNQWYVSGNYFICNTPVKETEFEKDQKWTVNITCSEGFEIDTSKGASITNSGATIAVSTKGLVFTDALDIDTTYIIDFTIKKSSGGGTVPGRHYLYVLDASGNKHYLTAGPPANKHYLYVE